MEKKTPNNADTIHNDQANVTKTLLIQGDDVPVFKF